MAPCPKISTIFKPSLYRKPYPLFIWDQGGTEKGNIWTAASLYWALVELDESTSRAPFLEEFGSHVTYENFPQLLRTGALKTHLETKMEFSRSEAQVVLFENPVSQDWLLKLPYLILNTIFQEYHFLGEPYQVDRDGPEGSILRISSQGLIKLDTRTK